MALALSALAPDPALLRANPTDAARLAECDLSGARYTEAHRGTYQELVASAISRS